MSNLQNISESPTLNHVTNFTLDILSLLLHTSQDINQIFKKKMNLFVDFYYEKFLKDKKLFPKNIIIYQINYMIHCLEEMREKIIFDGILLTKGIIIDYKTFIDDVKSTKISSKNSNIKNRLKLKQIENQIEKYEIKLGKLLDYYNDFKGIGIMINGTLQSHENILLEFLKLQKSLIKLTNMSLTPEIEIRLIVISSHLMRKLSFEFLYGYNKDILINVMRAWSIFERMEYYVELTDMKKSWDAVGFALNTAKNEIREHIIPFYISRRVTVTVNNQTGIITGVDFNQKKYQVTIAGINCNLLASQFLFNPSQCQIVIKIEL